MIGDAIGNALGDAYVAAQSKKKFQELRSATDGMQTAFVKTMVAELQKDSQKEFASMPGAEIYNDMENQVISEKLTASAHLGLSDTLYQPMAKLAFQQEYAATARKRNSTLPATSDATTDTKI